MPGDPGNEKNIHGTNGIRLHMKRISVKNMQHKREATYNALTVPIRNRIAVCPYWQRLDRKKMRMNKL
jgi:imidazoleglycerol phosphate dehydratase HisB